MFLHNTNGYFDRGQNVFVIGAARLRFVGILYAGPTITNSGEIVLGHSSRFEVASMMHLGFVVRSTVLSVIDDIVRKIAAELGGSGG